MSTPEGKPPHSSSPGTAFAEPGVAPESSAASAESAPENGLEFDYPEDIRPCPEFEDDHSTTDFDLNAELDRRLGMTPEAPGTGAAAPADDCRLHEDAEDIRPCPEHEDDHSTADFDLNAEIEAQLGKAEETAPVAVEKDTPERTASLYDQTPFEYYYPEDEGPGCDCEDDHSGADFDLSEEIERQAGIRNAATPSAPAGESPAAEELYPEYIRPGDEHEDDHSGADDGHGDANAQSEGSAETGMDLYQAEGVHPDLAASLRASLLYAQKGVQDDESDAGADEDAQADEVPDLYDDSPSPLEPEDSGDDDGMLPPESEADAEESAAGAAGAMFESAMPATGDSSGTPPPPDDSDDDEDDDEEEEDDDEEDEEDSEDRPMTLRDHFRDLRKRVFRAFLWMLGGFCICYPFAEEIFDWLFKPLMTAMPNTSNLIYTSPPEAFFTFLKVSLVSGLFIASPMIFYQIWAFVAPGLYKEEKLYILPVAFFSALFFISGGSFCYYIVFPFAFEFFMSYNKGIIQAMPALKETLAFVLQLLVAFGLVFEMPLFAFFLSRLGIVTADMLRRFRRYAVLVMVIVAAILTPPDVLSQMLMAGPLLVLYEFSILIAAIFGKKKPKDDDDEEEEEEEKEEKHPARV